SVPGHAPAELASDLADWARGRTEVATRFLRAVFGLDRDETGRPALWMEVRVTTPRLVDVPRSARQILQLASDLRRDPLLLAPHHTRLLRFLVRTVMNVEPFASGTRFGLKASTLNRVLDSFSDSSLATWTSGDSTTAGEGRDPTPGARLRLGEAALDIVPS